MVLVGPFFPSPSPSSVLRVRLLPVSVVPLLPLLVFFFLLFHPFPCCHIVVALACYLCGGLYA